MAKKKKEDPVPVLRVRKNATMREIYAAARKAFTAADLQRFTELDDGIPVEKVIAEMEAIHQKYLKKTKKNSR